MVRTWPLGTQNVLGGVVVTADYSSPVPVVYGTARVGGNLVYMGTRYEVNSPLAQSYDNGTWKQSDLIATAAAIALCEGPIQGLAQMGIQPGLQALGWFNTVPHEYATLDKLGVSFQVNVATGGVGVTSITLGAPMNNPTGLDGLQLVSVGDLIVQSPIPLLTLTGSISAGSTALAIVGTSVLGQMVGSALGGAAGFYVGSSIQVAGAGVAGAPLVATITAMNSVTNTFTLSVAASTTVSNANVNFDDTTQGTSGPSALGTAWAVVTSVTGAGGLTIGLDRAGTWLTGTAWVRHGANTANQYLGARPGTLKSTPESLSIYNGGTAWLWFHDMVLSSGAPPQGLAFEVSGFLLRGGAGNAPKDANPAAVLNDMLTSTIYGPGIVASHIDTAHGSDGTAASSYDNYCKAMGFYVSGALNKTTTALAALGDLLAITNSAAVFSQGALRIIPYGDTSASSTDATFTPATSATSLGPNDFLVNSPSEDPIKIERISPASVMNVHPVEFPGRAVEYNTVVVESMDTAAIQQATPAGLVRRAGKLTVPWVVSPQQAQQISLMRAQRANYVRQTFRFRVGWRYCYLEPMDFVALNEPNLGFVNRIARIVSIEEDGKLGFEVIAQDWPFGVGTPTTQAVQTTDGYTRDSGERVSGYTRASTQTATAESAADNLVPNGTSEMGVAAVAQGGVSANGLTKDPTNAYAGSWCRELVGYSGSSGTMSLAATNPLPCRVGDIFYASAQIKNSVGSAGGLTISFLDGNLNVLATASTTGTVTTSYALFSVTTAAAPSGTAYVQLAMTGNQLTGFTTYFDQLFMRRVIDTPIIGNQQVTRPNLVSVGQQISGSSGTFSTNSGTAVGITNFSVSLTTTGRPVVVGILHDGSGSTGGITSAVSVAGNSNIILILRDGTVVDRLEFGNPVAGGVSNGFPPPGLCSLDTGAAAGSHTYTAQAYCGVGGAPNAILVYYCKLVAYEL